MENTAPASKQQATTSRKTTKDKRAKRGAKKVADDDESEDELASVFLSETMQTTMQPTMHSAMHTTMQTTYNESYCRTDLITEHDRLISACVEVADYYMYLADEECRHNAVYFISKFLATIDSLDEEICKALKETLPERMRDRKPMIRAQAVLASRAFQDHPVISKGFLYHFNRDPELVVRKALLQIMDTKIFGHDFLVVSTQDYYESMRIAAFQRLGKISPKELNQSQLHKIMRNGLNERERKVSYAFKTHLLDPWLKELYDGIDLVKLLENFDVIRNHDDVSRLLELIYQRDMDKLESNGAATRLHLVVETFRDRWLNLGNACLPSLTQISDKIVIIWFSLIKFCKANQSVLKPVKVRPMTATDNDVSIEKILDSQEKVADEFADLHERLTPDLVNMFDFLKSFVQNTHKTLRREPTEIARAEFVYQQMMKFTESYEVGDEVERKSVLDVIDSLLRDNLLTGIFDNYIPPLIRTLNLLIYSKNSGPIVNYVSEMIQNVRSHLEDLYISSQRQTTQPRLSTIEHSFIAPASKPVARSVKKVKIAEPSRANPIQESDLQDLDFKIARIRVDLEELRDKYDECLKNKDFDQVKDINSQMDELKAKLSILQDRRCSATSDVGHLTMAMDICADADKMSSTMIADKVRPDEHNDSNTSAHSDKDLPKIFKHHSSELIKCLQMYFGCLQSAKLSEVPLIMLNHLNHLSFESLDDWYKDNSRVRSLMVKCNAITAIIDKKFALDPTTMELLIRACQEQSIELRTVGFMALVDVVCQYDDIELPFAKTERFLKVSLRDYGKYDPADIPKKDLEFITMIVEGTTKLFYHQKLASPEILAHLIMWWYHPRTDSRIKQYIGIFLPMFVDDLLMKHTAKREKQLLEDEESIESWLKELLQDTFVMSIVYLYNYILGPGYNIMTEGDMHSLISFLCNLIPVSFHSSIHEKVDEKIEEVGESSSDLTKYLKQAKNNLTTVMETTMARLNISSEDVAADTTVIPLSRPLFE